MEKICEDKIVLSCPGGKCPIKKSCATWNRPGGTLMPHEPFAQHGMSVKCYYLELKPVEHEQRVPTTTDATEARAEEKKVEVDPQVVGKVQRSTEVVATSQGQLFD